MWILALIFLVFSGRVISLLIYRICWANGETITRRTKSPILALLAKPVPWLLHLVMVLATAPLSWGDGAGLRSGVMMLTVLLAVGTIGRFGSSALGRFFLGDRLLVALLAGGVWSSPVFLYPFLMVSCCLQYAVASWPLGPGYSNLLGYEFVRASLCVILSAMAWQGLWHWCGGDPWIHEPLVLGAWLLSQASSYANHAFAKSALGPRWYSWIVSNRIECLFANAWLRGWTLGLGKERIFVLCQKIARYRRWLCGGVWLLEFSWIFLLADARLAVVILAATALFHGLVFLSTGLLAYEYVVNHIFLIGLILCYDVGDLFGPESFFASVIAIPLLAAWIGWLRLRILTSFQRTGNGGCFRFWVDAADHLMAWWDTPSMRMFSYTVETRSGKQHAWPVPLFSPYDTFLTDIHTHLMILGQHSEFDPSSERDRGIARTGVWGLTIHREDRDFLYQLMEDPEFFVKLHPSPSPPAWTMTAGDRHAASALAEVVAGMNLAIARPWFRWFLRWPHFPGEDLAPDLCPLMQGEWPRFRFDERIASVTVWRVKTMLHHTGLHLISQEKLGRICCEDPCTKS